MAVTRETRAAEFPIFKYTQDGLTGNLAATNVSNDYQAPGLYLYWISIRSNGAVATATVTPSIGGIAVSNGTALDLNVANNFEYSFSGILNIATQNPQVSTSTANSPTYDIAVMMQRVGDQFA